MLPERLPHLGNITACLTGAALLFALYLARLSSYLLFHTLVEIFSIFVACGIFVIAWNARRTMANDYLLFIGIASLFVGGVDFLHALTYKGMGVFPGSGANLPTQLWIVARLIQSVSLLVAPLFLVRKLKGGLAVALFLVATTLLLAAVFGGTFPDCFIEGRGLTPFKKGCEYLIALMLLASLMQMRGRMALLDRDVARLLFAAVGAFIVSELTFTIYADVYGISNMVGHFLKFIGFSLIFKAVIETGLARPYDLLFRELKLSEERYRHFYEDAPVMLHSIDRQGRLVNVSNFWLEQLGFERGEVLGRTFTGFMSEKSRRYAEETALPEYFRTGHAKDVPYRLVRKNGEGRDVLLSAVSERDGAGEIVRSLAVMVDVTERKRAAEEIRVLNADLAAHAVDLEAANCELHATLQQLAETNRELETANLELEAFNYTVSHDLRAPLTNINGCSQLLMDEWDDLADRQRRGFVESIYGEAQRMNQLISTLLDFSRLSRGEINRVMIDVSELAHCVAAELRITRPERRVAFSIADGLTFAGDQRLIRIVLENLFGNAWKYTGRQDEARIELGLVDQCGARTYFVRDDGIGFDMALADRLFAPFQRLHDPDDFPGHGIGLATVQRIIQRHGGRVWAEAEVGKGATFYFTLP